MFCDHQKGSSQSDRQISDTPETIKADIPQMAKHLIDFNQCALVEPGLPCRVRFLSAYTPEDSTAPAETIRVWWDLTGDSILEEYRQHLHDSLTNYLFQTCDAQHAIVSIFMSGEGLLTMVVCSYLEEAHLYQMEILIRRL